MATTNITIAGNTIALVTLPTSPGLRSVEFDFSETVAIVTSIFTGQTQVQRWPGADNLSGTATLPPLTQVQADAWISALMQCWGMANAFLLGDPMKKAPRGTALGAPAVDGSVAMSAGSNTLYTYGWSASQNGLLLPGDYLQQGYRLHRVIDPVNSDANGKASINIWPSLREVPTNGTPLTLTNAKGLFRLASNQNKWSADYTKLSNLSFGVTEYR
jgi:hypothetical protein